MDKLQAIRHFLKLGETLSFKHTAQHFGVPSSTVSRSIKALEKQLGVTLVERTTRRVRLTEAGAWYRGEVVGPLRALAAADALVDTRSREAAGTLRVTALLGYGEVRLFPILERFRSMHPRIICDLDLTDKALDLSTGDIDIALRATADPPDYLVARRLHAHRFSLVASPDYLAKHGRPRTVEDIEKHAAIAYRGPMGVTQWTAVLPNGELISIPRTPVLVTNHEQLMLQTVLAGGGIGFFPLWGISDELWDGRLVEIPLEDAKPTHMPGPERSIFLLYHPQKARLGQVRAMVNFLMQELAE